MVCAPDARDFVLVEELGDGPLRAGVDLHEEDVGDVDEEEDERLPPEDDLRITIENRSQHLVTGHIWSLVNVVIYCHWSHLVTSSRKKMMSVRREME